MTSLLEAKEVVKDFGGLRAVDHCSIAVGKGAICGLIGPNGAGKTTLFNLLAGFYKPTAGAIFFKDHQIAWNHTRYAFWVWYEPFRLRAS